MILAGHSWGGLSLSAAMEKFPEKIAAGVFATAGMPGPDLSYITIMEKVCFFKATKWKKSLKDSLLHYCTYASLSVVQ